MRRWPICGQCLPDVASRNSGPSAARRAIGELDTKSGFVVRIRQAAWVPRIHSCRSRRRKSPGCACSRRDLGADRENRLRSSGAKFRPFTLIQHKTDRHKLPLDALAEVAGYSDPRINGPRSGARIVRVAVHPSGHGKGREAIRGQKVDQRDLREVMWHLEPGHEPLEKGRVKVVLEFPERPK